MKNWKIPIIILGVLVLANVFRWGNLGSTTNNGVITKTSVDRWNGTVWQETIKKGIYSKEIINPSWIEASRKQVDKQVEYQEAVYSEPSKAPSKADPLYGQTFNMFDYLDKKVTYVTKTKTIQVPPEPIYWLSSNGLTGAWWYASGIITLWLLITIVLTNFKRERKVAGE